MYKTVEAKIKSNIYHHPFQVKLYNDTKSPLATLKIMVFLVLGYLILALPIKTNF